MDISDQIKGLMAEGKMDEAKALLKEAVTAAGTSQELGAELIGIAESYLELETRLQEEQIARMEEGLSALKELDREIQSAGDGEETDEIKKRLGMEV